MTTVDRDDQSTEKFTHSDYAQLPEGFRAFLLDGVFVRDPAPTWAHQSIVLAIAVRLRLVADKRVLVAPADVVIDEWTVLQPDVAVLRPQVRSVASADATEVPVLVVEVLSEATRRRDRQVKTRHYLHAGTCEVWLVDPVEQSIDVVTADAVRRHTADDEASSLAVPGFTLTWSELERESA